MRNMNFIELLFISKMIIKMSERNASKEDLLEVSRYLKDILHFSKEKDLILSKKENNILHLQTKYQIN